MKRREEPAPSDGAPAPDGAGPWAQVRDVLVRAVGKHCPAQLASMREDLVQVAFLKLAERGQREGNAAPQASYTWKVAFTVVVDELRRRRRGETYALEAASRAEVSASGPDIGLEIDDCLKRLSEDRRLAVTFYLQGFRMVEAATALGWSEKRVENLVHRGIKELRLCLGDKGVRDA